MSVLILPLAAAGRKFAVICENDAIFAYRQYLRPAAESGKIEYITDQLLAMDRFAMNFDGPYEVFRPMASGQIESVPVGGLVQKRGPTTVATPTESALAAAEQKLSTLRSQARILDLKIATAEKEVKTLAARARFEEEGRDQLQEAVREISKPQLLETLLPIMKGVKPEATSADADIFFEDLADVFTSQALLDAFATVNRLQRVEWVCGLIGIHVCIVHDKEAAAMVTAGKLERSGFSEFAIRVGTPVEAKYGLGDRRGQHTVRLSSVPGKLVVCGPTDGLISVKASLAAALLETGLPLQIDGQPLCRENGEFFIRAAPDAFASWEAVQVANQAAPAASAAWGAVQPAARP